MAQKRLDTIFMGCRDPAHHPRVVCFANTFSGLIHSIIARSHSWTRWRSTWPRDWTHVLQGITFAFCIRNASLPSAVPRLDSTHSRTLFCPWWSFGCWFSCGCCLLTIQGGLNTITEYQCLACNIWCISDIIPAKLRIKLNNSSKRKKAEEYTAVMNE